MLGRTSLPNLGWRVINANCIPLSKPSKNDARTSGQDVRFVLSDSECNKPLQACAPQKRSRCAKERAFRLAWRCSTRADSTTSALSSTERPHIGVCRAAADYANRNGLKGSQRSPVATDTPARTLIRTTRGLSTAWRSKEMKLVRCSFASTFASPKASRSAALAGVKPAGRVLQRLSRVCIFLLEH
jgi:hypothetical protein